MPHKLTQYAVGRELLIVNSAMKGPCSGDGPKKNTASSCFARSSTTKNGKNIREPNSSTTSKAQVDNVGGQKKQKKKGGTGEEWCEREW